MRTIVLSLAFACGLCAASFPSFNRLEQTPKDEPDSRIFRGENANEGEYPYMAGISKIGGFYGCGASILTKQWVLGTAQCCLPNYDLEVFVGSVHIRLPSATGRKHNVSEYYPHPNWDPVNFTHDACLFKIFDEFEFSDTVQPITLPTADFVVNEGDYLNITGWGVAVNGTDQYYSPDVLQVGKNFNALTNEHCHEITSSYGVPMDDSFICAGPNHVGQGLCLADAGCPLVKDGVLVGVNSFNWIPCDSGLPDFYSRVTTYLDWIQQVLGPDAKDLKFVN